MTAQDVDSYLAALPEDQRAALQYLREMILELAPNGEELLSYGVPAVREGGVIVAGYAAAKKHLSYFPHSSEVISVLADDLSTYSTSKGTLRFSVTEPLPRDLVEKLLNTRRKQAAQP